MAKKLLPGKTGEFGFQHDSPERINKCLNCTWAACINCFEKKDEDVEPEVDYTRPLLPDERRLLEVYPSSENDDEIHKKLGFSKARIYRMRKALGLPPGVVNNLSTQDKQLFANQWLIR